MCQCKLGAESQSNCLAGAGAPRHGGGHCAGPHTPIGQVLVAAARRGSRCEGEARELTTRQCTASSAIRPRWRQGLALMAGGGKTAGHFKNRLIAFLARVLDSPHRGRVKRSWDENQKRGQEKRLSDLLLITTKLLVRKRVARARRARSSRQHLGLCAGVPVALANGHISRPQGAGGGGGVGASWGAGSSQARRAPPAPSQRAPRRWRAL